jgi:hypothetical protein
MSRIGAYLRGLLQLVYPVSPLQFARNKQPGDEYGGLVVKAGERYITQSL